MLAVRVRHGASAAGCGPGAAACSAGGRRLSSLTGYSVRLVTVPSLSTVQTVSQSTYRPYAGGRSQCVKESRYAGGARRLVAPLLC